jgi:transposase
MSEPIFKPYTQNQLHLLPPDLNEMVPEDHLVRVIDSVIESIDLDPLKKTYVGGGAPAYDPKMMLKIITYAYASGIYSSRKIAEATHESIYFLWLSGFTTLDHMTINRFRSERLKNVFDDIFTCVIGLLAKRGHITLDTYFLDGTKVEATSSKYSFAWKGSTDKYQEKLREKVARHLDEIDRLNEEEDRLAEGLPDKQEVSLEDIRNAAEKINERLKKNPEDKDLKKASKAFEEDYIPRMEKYEAAQNLFEGRKSYSKTDTDATFMRMKEDHMRNGQLKAAYNIQTGTENQFIVSYSLHRRPGDTACMIEHLEKLKGKIGTLPERIVADAGYGSEENYTYLKENEVTAFVKHALFHKEQKRSFKKDALNPANWTYDEETDAYDCPGDKQLTYRYTRDLKSGLGYKSTTRIYQCDDCINCIHHGKCTKADKRTLYVSPTRDALRKQASDLLLSEEGIDLRKRRATDVETVFGNVKSNYRFTRFTMRGLAKVTLEWGLLALGHNMRKLCAQTA